jgi:hypothetical protein
MVIGLGESPIGRICGAHGLGPYRVETFKLSNDPDFVQKPDDIVGHYLASPENAVVFFYR